MDEIDITSVKRQELPRLAEILSEAEFWRQKGHSYEEALRFVESYDPALGVILTARIESKIVGLIWFTLGGTFYEFGYISLLAVAAGFQGRGIGAELMRVAEERIGEESKAVFLLVSDFNEGARRFYERLGYTPCGKLSNYKGEGNDEIIMWKADWISADKE